MSSLIKNKHPKSYHSPAPKTSHTLWTHSTSTAVLHSHCPTCFHWFGAKHSNQRWGLNRSSLQRHTAGRQHILEERQTLEFLFESFDCDIIENMNTWIQGSTKMMAQGRASLRGFRISWRSHKCFCDVLIRLLN